MMHANKQKPQEAAPLAAQPIQKKQRPTYVSKEGKKGVIQAKQRPVNKSQPEPSTIDPFALTPNPALEAYEQEMERQYGLRSEGAVQLKASNLPQSQVNINADPKLEREADVMGAKAMQMGKNNTAEPIQKKADSPNQTGLPDQLKTGIENLSGKPMDDVKVHYNSDKPAQLQAHAYAQGTDIHLASGQEKHLPHEAWHVVQQKEGRVENGVVQRSGKDGFTPDLLKDKGDKKEETKVFYVCNRPAFFRWQPMFNHTYFLFDNNEVISRGNSTQEKGLNGDHCQPYRVSRQKYYNVRKTAYNQKNKSESSIYIPLINDCQQVINNTLEQEGLPKPKNSYMRF